MPFATNEGVRIHYEVEGLGAPLVLMHGSGADGESWRDRGYVPAFKDRYRCILIDGRGHGESDKPRDPHAYYLSLRVADIVAVLDALGVSKAHYFGYSMGGWIGLGAAKYAPSRFTSFVIGASHPYERSMAPGREGFKRGVEAWVAESESRWGVQVSAAIRARMLRSDMTALLALTRDRLDMSEVLPTMTMPSLFFAGDADPLYDSVKRAAQHAPDAQFFSLPGLDHNAGMRRSDLVAPRVRKFLDGVPAA